MTIPQLSRGTWLALGAVGILLRLGLWWFTIGTNDANSFQAFGRNVSVNGVARAYELDPNMNHPPLVALFLAQASRWTGDDLQALARLVKILGLLGEAISLWALWRFAGPAAFGAYSLLPAAILVSGFHCNTDCLYAALVLLCALAFDRQRYFLAGMLLAAACDVKFLPVVLAPLLIAGAPSRRALAAICGGLALGLTPYLPPALTAASAMYHNIAGYNSTADHWGVLLLLDRIPRTHGLRAAQDAISLWYHNHGRYIMLASIVALAWLARVRVRLSMTEQFALGGALFLVLAPGFGVQYVVLIAPLLCMVDLREGLLWGWMSGVFIGWVYIMFIDQWWPAYASFSSWLRFPAWVIGLAAWAVLVRFVWRHVTSALSARRRARSGPARAY